MEKKALVRFILLISCGLITLVPLFSLSATHKPSTTLNSCQDQFFNPLTPFKQISPMGVFSDPYMIRFLFQTDLTTSELKPIVEKHDLHDFKSWADASPNENILAPKSSTGRILRPEELTPQQLIDYVISNYTPNRESELEKVEGQAEGISLSLRPQGMLQDKYKNVQKLSEFIFYKWGQLTYKTRGNSNSSLLDLPNPFVVPGGRFKEIYNWDTLWIIKGLLSTGYRDLALGMLDNFLSMFEKYGVIPNGNRYYYLTRTQPPILVEMMIELEKLGLLDFSNPQPDSIEARAFHVAEQYYKNVWKSTKRYVRSHGLFRYWDDAPPGTKRPERHLNDDVALNEYGFFNNDPIAHFLNERAGAESGWDFSRTRFKFRESEFLPVDLNALLAKYSKTMKRWSQSFGTSSQVGFWRREHFRIKSSMKKYMFSSRNGFYMDYDLGQKRISHVVSAASFFPFYLDAGLYGQNDQNALLKLFRLLKPNDHFGICTTATPGPGQWDGCWSWAPLNDMAFGSLIRLNLHDQAEELAFDYIRINFRQFIKSIKENGTPELYEKIRADTGELLTTGEIYGNEEGFGWTNGTLIVMIHYLLDRSQGQKLESLLQEEALPKN